MCSVENCERVATVGKICKYHYNKKRLENTTIICSADDCDKKAIAKGFCIKHYNEQHYKKELKNNAYKSTFLY
jgi:hypothetical protein